MNLIYILVMMFSIPGASSDQIEIYYSPTASVFTTVEECFKVRETLKTYMKRAPRYIGAACVVQDKERFER